MTSELDSVFRELGLAQYLDTFLEQGFDTWDTILDIQESDLDALGVKLGHRRKLQRRIANARGVAPGTFLVSNVKAGSDDGREVQRSEGGKDGGNETGGTTKRKYRRHPKPDENAPERPPSAYVLFSNKMREDLKSQNLTFTEIAKLVGENWQSLAPGEKESYESQANTAKEKYHRDLVEYKKTPEYRKYAQYLHEFKEKQAKQNQAHEAAKRNKVEPARLRHGSSSSSSANLSGINSSGGRSTSASGSGSERLQGSEPPPTRRERMNSTASLSDLHHPAPMSSGLMHHQLVDDARRSPKLAHDGVRDKHSRRLRHGAAWQEKGAPRADVPQRNLPSLSDMLDDGRMSAPHTSSEGSPYGSGFVPANRNGTEGPSVLPRGIAPCFQHEQSTGSNASLSSAASYGRQSEGPLPIHALLTNRPGTGTGHSHYDSGSPTSISGIMSPVERSKRSPLGSGPKGYGFQSASSAFEHMRVDRANDGDVIMSNSDPLQSSPITPQHRSKDSFDGMSALLQAGEIVGRRN